MAFDTRWKLQTLWALVLVLLVSPAGAQEAEAEKKSDSDEYFELMQVFVDTFEQVERNYVKDIDRRKLMEAALRGMLRELDPYSSYIPKEELARFNQAVDQEFGNQTVVFGFAGRRVPFAKVDVVTVDGYDSLPCGLMAAIGWDAKS